MRINLDNVKIATQLGRDLNIVLAQLGEHTKSRANLGEIDLTSNQYQDEFAICTMLCNAHVNWEAPDPAQVQLKQKITEGEEISTNLAADPTRIDYQRNQSRVAQEQWFYAHKILAIKKDSGALDSDTFRKTSHRILAAQHLHGQYLGQSSSKREGKKNKKNRSGQAEFSGNLKAFYNCFQEMNGSNHIWCPVMGDWFPRTETVSAHIVPWSFGEANAKIVFPMREGEGGYMPGKILMDQRNGLFLYKDIEREMDEGNLVILPYSYPERKRFKVYILDENLREGTFGPNDEYSWNSTHERELQFKNGNRPARRFLYFRMLLTILQRCVYQPQGWAFNIQNLIEGPVWVTDGEYLEASVIQEIVRLIGDPHVESQLIRSIPAKDSYRSDERESSFVECSANLAGLVGTKIFSD